MATKRWVGGARAVAQVVSGSIDSVDATPANNTFTVTIGNVAISVAGVTSAAATAAALVSALNASTHPYFAAITWANPSSGTITGTADTAGVPFTATLSKSGAGTGTVTNFSTSTAATGPNHWDQAANWSDNAVPADSDVIYIESGPSICWGLDQNALTLNELHVLQTYTGRIGLNRTVFATSSDGATTSDAAPEYRDHYLKLGADLITIGNNLNSSATPNGSSRIKINNNQNAASTCIVYNTGASTADAGMPAFRYLVAHASAELYVQFAPQGVGVAADAPGETSTLSKIHISDTTQTSRVITGAGTTLTTWIQSGGTNLMQLAATLTTLELAGGILTTEGDYTITTATVADGELRANQIKTAGNAFTTLNLYGGTCDFQRSSRARTVATLNRRKGTLKAHSDVLTITTRNQPEDLYTESVT